MSKLDELNAKQDELQVKKIENCNHYFVINDVVSDFDGHRTDRTEIITCIHCGLTNKFMNQYLWHDASKNVRMMNQIFVDNNCYCWPRHGKCSYNELQELKKIYDEFIDEYPNASNQDVNNHIAFVKKMRGGKLC